MLRLFGITLLMTVSWNASTEVRSSKLQSFLYLMFLKLCLRGWTTKVTYFYKLEGIILVLFFLFLFFWGSLDRVQTKTAQFINHTKDSDWETLAHLRTIARLCALFQAYSGERAWKAIGDRLRRTYYLSRLIMFGILGTGSKERISGSIPL